MKLFEDIDLNKRTFVEKKVFDLAWYTISIRDLQKKIDADGTVSDYDNGGGQSGTHVNPDVQSLNSFVKLSNDITRLLIDLVPAKARQSKLAAFADK